MIKIEPSVYIHYKEKNDDSCILDFHSVNYFHFSANPELRQTFLNNYMMVYVAGGNLNMLINEETISLPEKSLLIISPYTFYKTIAKSDEDNKDSIFYTVEFSCSDFIFFDIKSYILIQNAEVADVLFAELYIDCSKDDGCNYFYDTWLVQIFRLAKRLLEGNSEQKQLAERIKTYIMHNVMTPLTVNELSSIFKYNKDYICRIFKKEYNITIKDYINKEKIALAKKLLQTSDLSVSAIAQFLGWQDINLFLKYFKYHENISPSQYRANIINLQ